LPTAATGTKAKTPNFTHLFAIANPTKDRYLLELQAANIRDKFKSNDFLAKDDANKNAILKRNSALPTAPISVVTASSSLTRLWNHPWYSPIKNV
jgi:hypothetical protein